MQWSCVCPLLGLDLPWMGWSFPSYRGSPGWPALSAHFAKRNGAICTDALSRWYNPFTARPLLHSWFVWFKNGYCSRPTSNSLTGHRERLIWTHWKYVEWGEKTMQGAWSVLPPKNSDEILALVLEHGMKVLHVRITFDHWLSPWHDEISGQSRSVLNLLLKRSISENSPFKG